MPLQIDIAFQRRLNYKLYIPPPCYEDRVPLLKSFVGPSNSVSNAEWDMLASETEKLNTSGMKTYVQNQKDKLQDKIRKAKYFVLVNIPSQGPKFVPCRKKVRGKIKRENIDFHFSKIFRPKIRFKDLSSNQPSSKDMKAKNRRNYREQMKLTKEEFKKMRGVKEEENHIDSMYQEYCRQYKCNPTFKE